MGSNIGSSIGSNIGSSTLLPTEGVIQGVT